MTASFADNEIWHVLIAADDMKRMNVEQLDDAFRLSLVDGSTMVWKAGMNGWQRLGAVAGLDDEDPEDSVTRIRRAPGPPPPPPRPMARPVPKPPSPRPIAAASHAGLTPGVAAPLLAPVYTPPLRAPNAFTVPARFAIASEVDFRGRSRGVRWGRWLGALLLVTVGVLGAYRQNLLREGARRLGVENKYLYGEQRVTAFVSAQAPYLVKSALTRLSLLPGPNAVRMPEPRAVRMPAPQPAPRPPEPTVAPASLAAPPVSASAPPNEPGLGGKTVSLESLPVLGAEPDRPRATAVAAPAPRKPPALKAELPPRKHTVKADKREAVAKPKPAPPAVPSNDNPLKAAIRSAIAQDAALAK